MSLRNADESPYRTTRASARRACAGTRIVTVLVVGLVVAASSTAATEERESKTDPAGVALSNAMGDFVKTLDTKQRGKALYAFEDEERFDLRLAPLGLEGLRMDAMTEEQRAALHSAFLSVLSEEGLAKTDIIRSLEVEVAALEGGLFGFVMDRIRRVGRYFLAVFGDPSADAPWGLRLDGHHLSLNWTAVPGQPVSATPVFLGGQPREVPAELERAGLRVLAEEEDRAVELIAALDKAQRARARVPFISGSTIRRPMFVGDDEQLELEAPAGIDVVGLDGEQRARFDRLIGVHLGNFAEAIAARYRGQLAAEIESLRFAYGVPEAGKDDSLRAGQPFYYRIQSRGFLIEFDNTGDDADHIHVVIRSIDGDFGRDMLREHYAAEH
jgi:hypothetical protein